METKYNADDVDKIEIQLESSTNKGKAKKAAEEEKAEERTFNEVPQDASKDKREVTDSA